MAVLSIIALSPAAGQEKHMVFRVRRQDDHRPRSVDFQLNLQFEALLHGKEDALVVVGAAHRVGDQGVLALLRAKGYKIEQL